MTRYRNKNRHAFLPLIVAAFSFTSLSGCEVLEPYKRPGQKDPDTHTSNPERRAQVGTTWDSASEKGQGAAQAGGGDDPVKAGQALFAKNCTSCHGGEAEGRAGIGPALASESFLAASSDEFLTKTISEGRTGTTMTAWKHVLSPPDVQNVISFLRSLTPHEPAKLNEGPLKGDLKAGKLAFETICARCHGRQGGGYLETAPGTGIGRKAFLASVSNGYLRYIIKEGKSQTKMRPFDEQAPTAVANLTDEQIDGVIAYLRENAW